MEKSAQQYRIKVSQANGHSSLGDRMTRSTFDCFMSSAFRSRKYTYTLVPVDADGNEIPEQVPGMIEFMQCDFMQCDLRMRE